MLNSRCGLLAIDHGECAVWFAFATVVALAGCSGPVAAADTGRVIRGSQIETSPYIFDLCGESEELVLCSERLLVELRTIATAKAASLVLLFEHACNEGGPQECLRAARAIRRSNITIPHAEMFVRRWLQKALRADVPCIGLCEEAIRMLAGLPPTADHSHAAPARSEQAAVVVLVDASNGMEATLRAIIRVVESFRHSNDIAISLVLLYEKPVLIYGLAGLSKSAADWDWRDVVPGTNAAPDVIGGLLMALEMLSQTKAKTRAVVAILGSDSGGEPVDVSEVVRAKTTIAVHGVLLSSATKGIITAAASKTSGRIVCGDPTDVPRLLRVILEFASRGNENRELPICWSDAPN